MTSFIRILQDYQAGIKSVRRLLGSFGVTKWSMFTEPLIKLREDEVIALLLNWITQELPIGQTITLRIMDDHNEEVYNLTLKTRKGCIFVAALRKREDLEGKLLYYWPYEANYMNITVSKSGRAWQLQIK